MSNTLTICAVVALVICSAFFSASEIVYSTLSKPRIKYEAEKGSRKAARAWEIVNDYVSALSTILVGNNLVNVAATSAVTVLCMETALAKYSDLICTMMLLVFGEIMPKLLAADHANGLALRFSSPMRFFIRLFKPVVWLVGKLVDALSPLWTPKDGETAITDEELALVVDSIQEDGVITEAEGELIKSAIEFRETEAHEIMIPRVDMFAYNIEDPISELLADADALTFSRIPVYRETRDHIIGILPTKQLVKSVLTQESVNVEEMLLEPMFVHMTKNVGDILREMREKQAHMAIVLDEYGGTMGILTMEDILEEIVGEIYDETDEVEPEDVVEVKEDTFLMQGSMNIEDAFSEMEYTPRDFKSEYTTLSGWITEVLDRFPKKGDSFSNDALTVTVVSVDGILVDQVRIVVKREQEEE